MNPIKFRAARAMRKAPTPAEAALWQSLRKRALGFKFLRQRCMWGYIADFYCAKLRLVIEVDGSSHEAHGLAKDQYRDAALASHGITTMRFSNADVFGSHLQVLEQIMQFANSQRNSKQATLGAITQPGNPASMAGNAAHDAINTP